jgi:ADP-ribose pyrophosphatase
MNTPTLERIELISDGWVKKYVLTYRMPDGRVHTYEMASRKNPEALQALLEGNAAGRTPDSADAICIVARTPEDKVIMIREFRYPMNSWCIAFPAGLVEQGEDFIVCADRELREETGYAISPDSTPRLLPQAGYSSTGLTDETVQIVFVDAEKIGEPHTEENELIEVFELPISDITAFLETNKTPIGVRAQLILEAVAAGA